MSALGRTAARTLHPATNARTVVLRRPPPAPLSSTSVGLTRTTAPLSHRASLATTSCPAQRQQRPSASSATNKATASSESRSSDSKRFQPKVEVLPFRLPTADAREFLHNEAFKHVMLNHRTAWQRIRAAWNLFQQQKGLADFREQSASLKKISALYLPVWIVDAAFEVKCRGDDGRADATFVSISSRFPGHSWKPMDSLPIFPPVPQDAIPGAEQPQQKLDPDLRDYRLMVDYETYDAAKHLKPKDVDIEGGVPPPLPFTISPLQLPEMVRNGLADGKATLSADIPWSPDGMGLGLAEWQKLMGQKLQMDPLRFETETLKTHVLAAYPILMPLHLASFSFFDTEGRDKTMTFALGAWDRSMSSYALRFSDSEDWIWSQGLYTPLNLSAMEVYPRLPVKTPFGNTTKQKSGTGQGQSSNDGPSRDSAAEQLTKRLFSGNDGQVGQQSPQSSAMGSSLQNLFVRTSLMTRAWEEIKKVDWRPLEAMEEEAYANRIAPSDPVEAATSKEDKERLQALSSRGNGRLPSTEPRPYRWLSDAKEREAEETHPDRANGLGYSIHWTSPHVQRMTRNLTANHRYLQDGLVNSLVSRKRLANLSSAIDGDSDSQLTVKDEASGVQVKGEEAVETIRAADLDCRQNQERLKPRWLKELEAAEGQRSHDG